MAAPAPVADDPPKKAAAAAQAEPPDWKVLLDPTELVPIGTCVAAVIAFNRSEYGKAWYRKWFEKIPKDEKLAKFLLMKVTGDVANPILWGFSAFFTLVDIIRPKFFWDRRVQKIEPPSLWRYARVFAMSLLLQGLVNDKFLQPRLVWPAFLWRKGAEKARQIPTALQTLKEFAVIWMAFDFLYYIFHAKIMHNKYIYKWVHKAHHEATTPFVVSAYYQAPGEIVLEQVASALVPALVPVHPSTYWAWVAYRVFDGIMSHCGYNLPLFAIQPWHDYHHRTFESCYGVTPGFPIWDYAFGTHRKFMPWLRNYKKTHHWLTHARIEEDGKGFKDDEVGGEHQ
ncbi:hypothetical protein DFJ74DRAFT_692825 [Hyaloraphidium curvatum]|nr:hypothetical protein DFJ74DRAFT_692825 [Hyaloraphidium curvatum]